MQDNYFEVYLNNVLDLAATIVLKSDYSAQVLNTIQPAGSFDPFDRSTWKYYKNICGMYYVTDPQIKVISLDTQTQIDFTTTNLLAHRATWREYQFGNRYYNELIAKYPDQEQLILGILYPCDMAKALDAPEYSVLGYPSHLIEENEYTLAQDISDTCIKIMERWNNVQYRITDDLYEATMLGILYLNLPNIILNLRLERCHTNEIHSYHLREFLGSHHYLDKYIKLMTREQQLYFYRNINVIQRRIGRTQTYKWLLENILQKRNIPLGHYNMKHLIEPMYNEENHEVRFKKTQEIPVGQKEFPILLSTEDLMIKEDLLAKRNIEERIDTKDNVEFSFKHSLSNRVKTKVLESTMRDYSESSLNSLQDILIDHWVYLSSVNIYNSYITIKNPKTSENIPLIAKDAFILAFYLNAKILGFDLDTIPYFRVSKFQLIPTQTPNKLLKVVDKNHYLASGYYNDALELLKYQPQIVPIISTEAFYNKCLQIFRAINHQHIYIASAEDLERRGYLEAMALRIYGTADVKLTDIPNYSYHLWFKDKGIEIEDFLDNNIRKHYTSIIDKMTGLDLNTVVSIKNIQARMLDMFSELSSYSLQILKEINEDSIKILNWSVIRLGKTYSSFSSIEGLIPVIIDVLDAKGFTSSSTLIPILDFSSIFNVNSSFSDEMLIEVPDLFDVNKGITTYHHFLDVISPFVHSNIVNQEIDEGIIPVDGYEVWKGLSPIERSKYKHLNDGSLPVITYPTPDNPYIEP